MTLRQFGCILLCLGALAVSACADKVEDELLIKYGAGNESFRENTLIDKTLTALWCDPVLPDADSPMTISFRAGKDSDLYNYKGEVYAHIGVIQFGVWTYVKADWPDKTSAESMQKNNRPDCKFVQDESDPNLWHLHTVKNDGSGTPVSVREYFNDGAVPIGETPIAQIGIVIRSADGSKKGIVEDRFFKVSDTQFEEFKPKAVEPASLPSDCYDRNGKVKYGPNCGATSITFVLHDEDINKDHKDFAFIVGDFNDWTISNNEDAGSKKNSEMFRDDATGCWWITIEGLDPTKEYCYQYHVGDETKDGYSVKRISDAFCEKILDGGNDKWINYKKTTPIYPEEEMKYPPQGIDLVSCVKIQRDTYPWSPFEIKNPESLVVYELLLGDFTEEGSLRAAMAKLDYLKTLGINAIELMPIQEFDGVESWGYSPNHYFAMDKAYGTAKDYKDFIEACHQRDIAVIIDVVYNHNTGASPLAKLYWNPNVNKTAPNNPYFNVDAAHPWNVFHDYNHKVPFVNDLVKRSLKYLIDEYKVDGFRFDLSKGFIQTAGYADWDRYSSERVEIWRDYSNYIKSVDPDCFVILEHLGDWGEECEFVRMGMHPWRKMTDSYISTAKGYSSSLEGIHPYIEGYGYTGWVGFMESHDEQRVAYRARRDGTSNIRAPFSPTDQKANIGVNIGTRMNQLALNAVCFLTVPGPKMIWQMGELGYDYNKWCSRYSTDVTEGEDFSDSSEDPKPHEGSRKPVKWGYLYVPERKALYDVYCTLNQLRNNNPELFGKDVNYTPDLKGWPLKTSYSESGGKKMQMYANFNGSGAGDKALVIPDGTWRDYMTGQTVRQGAYTLKSGEYLVLVSPEVQ